MKETAVIVMHSQFSPEHQFSLVYKIRNR